MVRAEHRDSRSWRARAEECRSIADGFSNPETRARMLRMARDYERMAEVAEEREAAAATGEAATPGRAATAAAGRQAGQT